MSEKVMAVATIMFFGAFLSAYIWSLHSRLDALEKAVRQLKRVRGLDG